MSILDPTGAKVTPINQRALKKELSMRVETVGEVIDLAHDVARQVVNNLGNQIPAKVEEICAAMISEAMAAFIEVLEAKYVMTPRVKTVTVPTDADGATTFYVAPEETPGATNA